MAEMAVEAGSIREKGRVTARTRTTLIALGLFVLALAVRLPGLDTFFTADEFLWVDRSRVFLGGLLSPDFNCLLPNEDKTDVLPGQGLACTLRTGHPGVITMWTGALGIGLQWLARPADDSRTLLEFVEQLPTNPVERATIAPVRAPTAVLTALFVVLFYLLLGRLFQAEVAMLAALLLALNPFHIALSRVIHHDALSTIFIIASALSLMIYFGVERRRGWLMLAGALGGLAMLSKSTGLFLIPYAGLLGLWAWLADWARGKTPLGRGFVGLVWDGIIWALVAGLTFSLFWPAMWVIPAKALLTIYTIGFKYASGGHAKGVFFFDTISKDPGSLFYPAMWLFRTNFWSLLGVLAAVVLSLGALRRRRGLQVGLKGWLDKLSPRGFNDKTGLLLWIGAFLFFFMIAMTVGEKKQDRYVLPIYPLLDLIAAIGLLTIVRGVVARWVLFGLVLIVNLVLILPRYPYYFTYYNPLLGGIKQAAREVTIGWGEGLDLAAAYLNDKPDAENLTVSTWYGSTFAPFFKGETIRYSDQKGNALGGDYVVFYVNQRQRDFPDEEIWRYFTENFTLDKTISLDGVDYAWIFTGPHIGHYVEDQRYTGIASLLGWDWRGSTNPDTGPVVAGSVLDYALYWEYLGKSPDDDFFLRLIGPDGHIWAEAISQPIAQYADITTWREGQIIEEQGTLVIPPTTPPGAYTLQIGFYTAAPAVVNGELIFPTLNQPLSEPLQTIDVTVSPAATLPAGIDLLDLQLLDQTTPLPDKTGEALAFDLTWAVPEWTSHNYKADFALVDDALQPRWSWPARPLIEFLSTTDWPQNRPLRSQWSLPLESRTPGGTYTLELSLSDEAGQTTRHELGSVVLPGRARNFAVPSSMEPVEAGFAEGILIRGYEIDQADLLPGETQTVTLVWQAAGPIADDYTVFLQLLGPDGQVIAQQDRLPLDGGAPTSTWTPGEVLVDRFVLTLPEALPVGSYWLITGFYRFETGQRLATSIGSHVADFVELKHFESLKE